MIENIKLALNYTDNTKDNLINLYINKVKKNILNHCNLDTIPTQLESFIEDKVINILETQFKDMKQVKSVSRGDTKIDYNVATPSEATINMSFTDTDKIILNRFRKLRK